MVWLIGFAVTLREITGVKILEKLMSQQNTPKAFIFKGWRLANGS